MQLHEGGIWMQRFTRAKRGQAEAEALTPGDDGHFSCWAVAAASGHGCKKAHHLMLSMSDISSQRSVYETEGQQK